MLTFTFKEVEVIREFGHSRDVGDGPASTRVTAAQSPPRVRIDPNRQFDPTAEIGSCERVRTPYPLPERV